MPDGCFHARNISGYWSMIICKLKKRKGGNRSGGCSMHLQEKNTKQQGMLILI